MANAGLQYALLAPDPRPVSADKISPPWADALPPTETGSQSIGDRFESAGFGRWLRVSRIADEDLCSFVKSPTRRARPSPRLVAESGRI